MYAAGFRPGDIVHNSFSYHLTPAGSMAESGARALGLPVIPGGTGQTELQLRAIADIGATAYAGTPSFLLTLLEKGQRARRRHRLAEEGAGLGRGAFRRRCARGCSAEFGIDAVQCYASADLGLIAYESVGGEGLIVDEAVILEIVRPGTGDPLPDGEVGEVVVTVFNPDYPLIRFATGDLSAVLPGQSPCGRTNLRIKGWLGRADQATKVRGMFVQPRQVRRGPAPARRWSPGAARGDPGGGHDEMRLLCEVDGRPNGLEGELAETVRALTGLRAEIELVDAGQPAQRRQGHRRSALTRSCPPLPPRPGLRPRRALGVRGARLRAGGPATRCCCAAPTAAASRPCCACSPASCGRAPAASPGTAAPARPRRPSIARGCTSSATPTR